MITLEKETREELIDEVKRVLEWSQGVEVQHAPELIDHWFESKKAIINKFSKINDGEFGLICELDEVIEMDISETEKEYKFNNFMGCVGWRDEVIPLRDFINANREGFFDNIVVADYKYGDHTITKGSKLLKAFKFFIKDDEERKWLQDKASIAIQECKITGRLCLSVHPLDYLSVSENTYNWRSCHALDGEYRAGNLNYMCDKSTIVCYLKGTEDAHLPHFPSSIPWNSKKWRCLLYLSDDWRAMFAGRQYPMTIDKMLDRIQQVAKLALDLRGSWSAWHNDQITQFDFKDHNVDTLYFNNPYIPMAGKIYPIRNLIKDGEYTHHYNDLLRSTCYIPYYCWSKEISKDNLHFHIGEEIKCLCCGKNKLADHDNIYCCDCYDQEELEGCTCADCGNFTIDRDLRYIERYDVWVCQWCYDHNYIICGQCHDLVAENETTEHHGHSYCQRCMGDIRETEI